MPLLPATPKRAKQFDPPLHSAFDVRRFMKKKPKHNSLLIPPKETVIAERVVKTRPYLKNLPKPPIPKFELGQTIKVHNKVCDGCSAVICGMEYGPDNHRLKVSDTGWVYYLRFAGQVLDNYFTASEEEIIKWQEGKK